MGEKIDGSIVLSQISISTAVMEEISRQAKKEGLKDFGCRPDQLNAIFTAATSIVEAFGVATKPAEPGQGLEAWRSSHDTGLSSLAMASRMFGIGCSERTAYPRDPGDFGRCYRFLRAVPLAKERLPMMSSVSPIWAGLVEAWPELEALYERELPNNRCPDLYCRMKEIEKTSPGRFV